MMHEEETSPECRCPQCGNQVAQDTEQCPLCGFWLVTRPPEPQPEPLPQPQAVSPPLPPPRLDGFLEEDILAYWKGGWGEKMLPHFRAIAAGKPDLSVLGLLFPSIWLAFRRRWPMALAANLLVSGVPMVLHALLFPWLGQTMAGGLSAVETFSSLGVNLLLAWWLPRWFWQQTRRALTELGCHNRQPGADPQLTRQLEAQGGGKPLNLVLGMLLFYGVTLAFLPVQALLLKLLTQGG